MDYVQQIAAEMGVRPKQVEEASKLLDAGNTIPFIARYRKEATGELDEEQLRTIDARLTYLRNLDARKEEVLKSLTELEKLTPELQTALASAVTLQEVEDIYRPYKPKRKTRASVARERGLEPLARKLQQELSGDPLQWAMEFVQPDNGVETPEAALEGAMDILAEEITDDAAVRREARELAMGIGLIKAELKDEETEAAKEFEMYRSYQEAVKRIPPHRLLAINRGEKLNVLKVSLEMDETALLNVVERHGVKQPNAPGSQYIRRAVEDGMKRLLLPSLEREIRAILTERSEEQAIKVFGINLRNLLLQPPVKIASIIGIDPGFRTGSKVAVIDTTGKLLATVTIYPHAPQNRWAEALDQLKKMIIDHRVGLVAIGNGTASRETELLVAELLHGLTAKVQYCIVSEAGASVYSASPLAKQEFPELDVSMRGAVSIARRLLDPLAELVKIDPRSIGVGQYQHDVDAKALEGTLSGVVESCVNYVGVDLNTASPSLLKYVAGIGPSLAKKIVEHREKNGRFTGRKHLLKVSGLGEKAFTQASGFIRVPESEEPLDNTGVHPESYGVAKGLLKLLGYTLDDLRSVESLQTLRGKLQEVRLEETAQSLGVGVPTLKDIVDALARPGRDPREELPPPILRNDVMKMEDLREGMLLQGTVRNVVDFGAFVDIGVKQDGLVHISELSDSFVRHPMDKVAVGDVVKVRIISVDLNRQRIGLSMKNTPAS